MECVLFVGLKVHIVLHLFVMLSLIFIQFKMTFFVSSFYFPSSSLSSEIDECQVRPDICGAGICYNTAESYTCFCDDGYRTDSEGTTCVGERSKVNITLLLLYFSSPPPTKCNRISEKNVKMP